MDIQFLKGVGEKRAQKMQRLGISTIEDLFEYYPRDYINFSNPVPLIEAPYDIKCVICATVYEIGMETRVQGGKKLRRVQAGDASAGVTITYFNNPYAVTKLKVNETYLFYGKISGGFTRREMVNPIQITKEQMQKRPFQAIYAQTQGINSHFLTQCIENAKEFLSEQRELLPQELVRKYKLCSRAKAIEMIHLPKTAKEIHEARRRLIFEELFALQLGLFFMRHRAPKQTKIRMEPVQIQSFLQELPFEPTNAQQRAIEEIMADLQKNQPMNRLLQGDVGSGKTLVAAAAVFMAVQNGYQAALMAPTEILATQHTQSFKKMMQVFGMRIALLSASMKASEKKQVMAKLQAGEIDLLIGTHALLSEQVVFANLGLVITDEQHRFGVRQRGLLMNKSDFPHTLVMSATPIPRTLGLLMFGDLDLSILDEMPKGRIPVRTCAISSKKRADLFGFLDKQIEAGRQAYLVCPLIEEGESDLQSITQYYRDVVSVLLPHRSIAMMHGKLKAKEKQEVMESFQKGEIDILVSTTVIEVGVDVPNATCIVIENAERYGLSALHQLRGRVGRGGGQAFCILVTDHKGESVKKRLSFLCHTTDGFEIAKFDLETRGPGDFFGNRQHGLPVLKIADFMQDSRILYVAQKEAMNILQQDANLQNQENQGLRELMNRLFKKDMVSN